MAFAIHTSTTPADIPDIPIYADGFVPDELMDQVRVSDRYHAPEEADLGIDFADWARLAVRLDKKRVGIIGDGVRVVDVLPLVKAGIEVVLIVPEWG